MPSGVWPTVMVSTTRGGFAVMSIRLIVSASPPPRPMLPTAAYVPSELMSMPYGRSPALRSRLVYSTLAPSMDSTEMRSSPSRETRAVLPSGLMATWLTPVLSSPSFTVPAGAMVFPLMVKIETVPSDRLATRARVPCRLMETPAGPLPVSSVAITWGGDALRSITDIRLSGICFFGSPGSIFMAAVTRARPSSGVMATLNGGPTTLVGAAISATIRGGYLRSITDTVSTAGFWATVATPSMSTSLLSLAESASCASPGTTDRRSSTTSDEGSARRIIAASLGAGMNRPILFDLHANRQGGYHRAHGRPLGTP